jgi:REP element-mobilizing transposase RayT
MPDHVHLLIRRHRDWAEDMIEHFQQASRADLIEAGKRPAEHPVWGGPGWRVFLDTREGMERTARYIHDNPLKARRPEQRWEFVAPYNGWLPAYRRPVS